MSKVYILKIHVDNRDPYNMKYYDRIIDVFANEKDAKTAMAEFDIAEYWRKNHIELRAGIWEELSRYSPEDYFVNATFVNEYAEIPLKPNVIEPDRVRLVAFTTYEIVNDAGFVSVHIHEYELK